MHVCVFGGGGVYWYNYVTSRKDGYASFLARMKDCSNPAKKLNEPIIKPYYI